MEAKIVIRNSFYLLVFLCCTTNVIGQSITSKYLMFNKTKDSIVILDAIMYYKIDNNLFDINRYEQIDTLSKKVMNEKSFISVEKLWKEGKELFHKVSTDKNLLIETYNEIFENIYVIEKLSDCKYKRTRVWWVDY